MADRLLEAVGKVIGSARRAGPTEYTVSKADLEVLIAAYTESVCTPAAATPAAKREVERTCGECAHYKKRRRECVDGTLVRSDTPSCCEFRPRAQEVKP